ncbi:MAG TPA: hypothetical protein VNL94_03670 [Candidatus Binatia bacterium]|nr:hypothetical protein [Candidatus Binatia bacterium]
MKDPSDDADAPGANDASDRFGAEAMDGARPLVERFGLAAIAGLLAAVFGFVAIAAWSSGEVFLAVMAGVGALMTIWAAASTLRRA